MTLFRQTYRIESARLGGWDYAAAGWYFVTICTRDQARFFGEVVDGAMRLSPIGELVAEEWLRTPQFRSYVELDQWVIRPNHLHGIIIIERKPSVETPRRGVSTRPTVELGSLGSIVGQFKMICTKRIKRGGRHDFAWQPRFYDHIIRDEEPLDRIREYITNNPMKWESDKDNPANLYPFSEPSLRKSGPSRGS